jgi:hypothetical protein
MNVYLDESGDLGWKFDAPYMRGGSSRFLTIAMLITPKDKAAKPKRLVKKLYKYTGAEPKQELKASHLDDEERKWFSQKAADMLLANSEIKLVAITVKKENVWEHIRQDPNKLYNYMIKLALIDQISQSPQVSLIHDERSVKVKSGNSMADYLQSTLWFERNSRTVLQTTPMESKNSLGIQFADYIANFIWRRHEFNDSGPSNILRPHIIRHPLFF